MLTGHTIGLLERSGSSQLLLHDHVSETDEVAEISRKVLYRASFEELADHHLQYDTIIWILISLLLVLAWGVGVVMLLYLPIRRYILQKDISSRKLYVTPIEIVCKVIRPSFLPFLGLKKIEKRIPLHLIINIVIEQGCLQSIYGIHTFRVENIAYEKASPVDELQVQGVSDPELLRKVIISEAAKSIQEVGCWKPRAYAEEGESTPTHSRYFANVSPLARFQSPSAKMMASPHLEAGAVLPGDLFLHKLEEVKQSVKKIESLVEASQDGSDDLGGFYLFSYHSQVIRCQSIANWDLDCDKYWLREKIITEEKGCVANSATPYACLADVTGSEQFFPYPLCMVHFNRRLGRCLSG